MRRMGFLCLLLVFLMFGTSCGNKIQVRTLRSCGESLIALMDDMVNSDESLSSIGLPGITAEKQ